MPIIVLGVLVAGLILLGLALTTKVWADATMRASAGGQQGGLSAILTLPARLIARAVLPGVNYIAHKVSQAASHYMGPIARWFEAQATWWHHRSKVTETFANDTAYGIERIPHVVIPREVGKRTRPIDRRAKRAGKIAAGAALSGAALRKAINQWRHHHVEPALRNLLHRTTVALPRAIGRIGAREKALSDRLTNPSRAWVKRIGRRLWIGALAGLMVRWLARKFPWLFCRTVKNIGKRACRLDPDVIGALFLDAIVIYGAFHLRDEIRALQQITKPTVDLIRDRVIE